MALTKQELVMHPVRLRILTALGNETMTTQQLSELLPDVPQSTLYRHLRLLLQGDMLALAETRLVHGIQEKTYKLAQLPHLGADDMTGLSADDHLRLFTTYVMTLLASFADYLRGAEAVGDIDMLADKVGYTEAAFYANDAEMEKLGLALNQAVAALAENSAGDGRRRRKLAIISHPAGENNRVIRDP